jgi:hypothetical protein
VKVLGEQLSKQRFGEGAACFGEMLQHKRDVFPRRQLSWNLRACIGMARCMMVWHGACDGMARCRMVWHGACDSMARCRMAWHDACDGISAKVGKLEEAAAPM